MNSIRHDEEPARLDGGRPQAYLLTWNPEHFKFGGDDGVVPGTEQRWTCHSKQPRIGDRLYLVRLGSEPRGIVAQGTVSKAAHDAPHWRDQAKVATYIGFKVVEFRPTAAEGLISMALLAAALPGYNWSPQRSGVAIAEPVQLGLDALWSRGSGVHSLRQYADWVAAQRDPWIERYREAVALARSIRNNESPIDEHALDVLWRAQDNGVTNVGAGALSNKEFVENSRALIELTRAILADPTPRTLATVESRWAELVEAKAVAKLRRAVIRRVFAAARPEQYTTLLRESDCRKALAALRDQFQLSNATSPATDWAALNEQLTSCMVSGGLHPRSSVENNTAIWRLVDGRSAGHEGRPPSPPPLDDESSVSGASSAMEPLNLILFGPPGTGKTYQAIAEAIELLEPEMLEGEPDRVAIKRRFDELVASGRIVFTTFHQSFSYEDFVEGLRADTDGNGQLRYTVVDGVFKRLCRGPLRGPEDAMSASAQPKFTAGESFNGYLVERATADVVELRKPNGRTVPLGMSLLRELARLLRDKRITLEDIREKRVFERIPDTRLEPNLVNGYHNLLAPLVERLAQKELHHRDDAPSRVLIIDEINRGNVAKIFGELITLLEPSKRAGMPEALEVVLPYSKQPFSVPANLHIVGTMNTADRSLVGLDVALRRRFEFREVGPQPNLLDDVFVDGISIGELLRVINGRVEVLLDREHRLGHAYFMALARDPSIEQLARIFRTNVVPLLQEYFFDDWQRIRWVLNDHRKPSHAQFISDPEVGVDELFGSNVGLGEHVSRWCINEAAFDRQEAYAGVIHWAG